MKNKFQKTIELRRLWAHGKKLREKRPKAKTFTPFFKRKLPPARRS